MPLRLAFVALAVPALAACGHSHKAASTSTTTEATLPSEQPTTQVTILPVPTSAPGFTGTSSVASPSTGASLRISPATGAAGTAFTFTASGFQPGETVHFQITPPDGKTTTGPAHVASSSGVVSATYKTSSTSPRGTYSVTGTGDRGGHVQAHFAVTAASASSTRTTARTTTTRHS